jgi:hypothetical protein
MQPPRRRTVKPAPAAMPRVWRRISLSLAALVVAGLAWTGLWYLAASVAERTLAGWMTREAAAGRVYSCGTQSIGGFPLRIEARCIDTVVEIQNEGVRYSANAKTAAFAAEVWHPTALVGDIGGPVALGISGQSPTWTANWTRARLTLSGVPPTPDVIAVLFDDAQVDGPGDRAAGAALFAAKRADFTGRLAAGSPADRPVIELDLHLTGATAPFLHALFAVPFDAEADTFLRGFKNLAPKPWAERFREMNAAGGGIEIKSVRFTQSNAIVAGTGTLTVNAHGKLDGLISVAIVGLDRLVPLLGIDRLIGQGIDQLAGSSGSAAQAVSVLDRLVPGFGEVLRDSANSSVVETLKKMGEPTTLDGHPATLLPLRFVDGSVYFGMLRVGEVPALF